MNYNFLHRCIYDNLKLLIDRDESLLEKFIHLESDFLQQLYNEHNGMVVSLNQNDFYCTQLDYIATKIEQKNQIYKDLFENELFDSWVEMGLSENVYEEIDTPEFKAWIRSLLTKAHSEKNIQIIFIKLEYYILVYSKKPLPMIFSKLKDNVDYISSELEVENILNEKLYEKYKQKRTNEIFEILNISDMKMFKDIVYYFFHNMDCEFDGFLGENEKNLLKNNIFNNKKIVLQEIDFERRFGKDVKCEYILKPFSSIFCMCKKYCLEDIEIPEEIFDTFFKIALDNALLIHLKDCITFFKTDKPLTLSMIVRQTEIKNIELFLSSFLHLLFESHLFTYINFISSIDNYEAILEVEKTQHNITNQNIIENQTKEIEDLNEQIKMLELRLSNTQSELDKLNKNKSNDLKTIENKYAEEIISLKKKVSMQETEINNLTQDTCELNEIRKVLFETKDESDETFDLSKFDLSVLKDKRVVFIGGRFELLKRLESYFPKGKFYHTKPRNDIDISKTDKIIIFPKNINHPLYWYAIDIAKSNKVPFILTNGTNVETVLKDILMSDNSWQKQL